MAAAASDQPMTSTLLWLLLLLASFSLTTGVGHGTDHREKCQVAPPWSALQSYGNISEELQSPMLDNRGKVVLVALTAASSGHSLHQAKRLDALYSYFRGIEMVDLQFLLVNSRRSDRVIGQLNLTLPIFQETDDDDVWNKLEGKKDDIFIYDRCGRLTYYVPFPLSTIHPRQQLVESAVISTYLDDLCGERWCNSSNPSEDYVEVEMLNSTHNLLVDIAEVVNVTEQITLESESREDQNNGDYIFKNGIAVEENNSSTQENQHNMPIIEPTSEPESVWSLVKNFWNKMPWASKTDKAEKRKQNSVFKFTDKHPKNINTTATPINTPTPSFQIVFPRANATTQPHNTSVVINKTTEESSQLCNATVMQICRDWSTKKLDHATKCCSLDGHSQNTTRLRKHCKHYTKPRCYKVNLVLKCCRIEEADKSAEKLDNPAVS